MPELPEVEITRRGIEPHLLGQTVTDIVVHQRQLRWPVPCGLAALRGAVVRSVERRAKYILVRSDPGTVLIHLGMSGSLRLVSAGKPLRKHDHLEFYLSSGDRLRFHDPRRFGSVLWTALDPVKHKLLASLGPEPLGEQFDGAHLFARSRGRKVAVKKFIMHAGTVVGVGNIYANEALFLAGIRPRVAAGRVSRSRCVALAGAIRDVLTHAIGMGGTTLRDFVNPQGSPGYFQQSLYVYGRAGKPCRHCQEPIAQKRIGQRSTFYCARCQPL